MNLIDIKDIQEAIKKRVIFFLSCLGILIVIACYTAVNPKTTLEMVGFRPFKDEDEAKKILREKCLQIEVLKYAEDVYINRIRGFENVFKNIGAEEIQSQTEKNSTDNEPKKYRFKFNEQDDFSTKLFYGNGVGNSSEIYLLESYAQEKWAGIYSSVSPRSSIECLNQINLSEDNILSCYAIMTTMTIHFHLHSGTEKMNSKFSMYLPKVPFPLDETLLSTDQTRITATDLFMDSSFFDKNKRKQLFEYAQQHHSMQGISITNSDMENLIKHDKKMQKEIAERVFQKIEISYQDVFNSHKIIVNELNGANKDLEEIFIKFASDDVLYMGIIAHRIIIGVVFITGIMLLLKAILTDLNLQRTIHIGEIGRAYAKKDPEGKMTNEDFKEMFELFEKSVGVNHTVDKNEKQNVDSNQILQLLEKFKELFEATLSKISSKQE